MRKKIRYVIKKSPAKNEVKKKLSSCVEERFNSFEIIRHMFEKEQKEKFQPVDIAYKPIKSIEQNIECFFTDEIHLAYRALVHRGNVKFNSMTAEQCFSCNNFFVGKATREKHLEKCSQMPGVTYKFENQHLTTFEDNFRFMGELPFTVYFDLEATCGHKEY